MIKDLISKGSFTYYVYSKKGVAGQAKYDNSIMVRGGRAPEILWIMLILLVLLECIGYILHYPYQGQGGVKCLLSMNVSNLNILKEIKKNDQEEREKY